MFYCLFIPSRQLLIDIRAKPLGEKMSRVKEIKVVNPSTNVGGSGQAPPPSGGGNRMKPSTPTGSKADQLTSELKVLKLE
jgi:hypothetical protein